MPRKPAAITQADVARAIRAVQAAGLPTMRTNGFEDIADLTQFWWAEHPPQQSDTITFEGVLIRWQPLAHTPATLEPKAA